MARRPVRVGVPHPITQKLPNHEHLEIVGFDLNNTAEA
jgi:hypothetical protein